MKVIVAIDDSPYSDQIIDSIVKRRWPDNVQFKILTILEPFCNCIGEELLTEFSDTLTAIQERRIKACQCLGKRVLDKLESKIPGAHAHIEIREGIPRKEIVNAAVDWQANRILMGAHGRDICPHHLLGSVSRSVVNHAPCTVEIVRPQVHPRSQRLSQKTETKATK